MLPTHNTWAAMTAVTMQMPPSTDGAYPAESHLVGIGLFLARSESDRWRFKRSSLAICAGEPESSLLEAVAARLPDDGKLIGWNVDRALIPRLLEAAGTAPPTVAQCFLKRLQPLLRGGVLDLALGHGTASLAETAADLAIRAPAWSAHSVSRGWAAGQVDRIRQDLADEALAIWRVFVRTAGFAGLDAETATDAWIMRRRALRLVMHGDRAADHEPDKRVP